MRKKYTITFTKSEMQRIAMKLYNMIYKARKMPAKELSEYLRDLEAWFKSGITQLDVNFEQLLREDWKFEE